jgi:hypothetical protein
MLPQFRTLEVRFDAPVKAKTGTSRTRLATAQAGFQHGRGEPDLAQAGSATPVKEQSNTESGVSRIHVIGRSGEPASAFGHLQAKTSTIPPAAKAVGFLASLR